MAMADQRNILEIKNQLRFLFRPRTIHFDEVSNDRSKLLHLIFNIFGILLSWLGLQQLPVTDYLVKQEQISVKKVEAKCFLDTVTVKYGILDSDEKQK
jgi:hypothetical protein